jgi:nucleoside-diphosphate-sugar epimerase
MSLHINKPQSALLLGAGYVARALAPRLVEEGWSVDVTTRSGQTPLENVTCHEFYGEASAELQARFVNADIIVTSIPPLRDGTDPALQAFGHMDLRAEWIAYLSATSVYGDRSGRWAYEGEPPTPGLKRGKARAEAELAWIETLWPVHIFRLAGIYGPGRAPFDKLRQNKARTILKDDHVVNRIHVDDIVDALCLSLKSPNPQSIYNLADGHPAPPQDVLDYAAGLLGLTPPPRVALDDPSISDMARSFYTETKRISADKARQELGWTPQHTSYRDGLEAILRKIS